MVRPLPFEPYAGTMLEPELTLPLTSERLADWFAVWYDGHWMSMYTAPFQPEVQRVPSAFLSALAVLPLEPEEIISCTALRSWAMSSFTSSTPMSRRWS